MRKEKDGTGYGKRGSNIPNRNRSVSKLVDKQGYQGRGILAAGVAWFFHKRKMQTTDSSDVFFWAHLTSDGLLGVDTFGRKRAAHTRLGSQPDKR